MNRREMTRVAGLMLMAAWTSGRHAEAGLTLTAAATSAGFGLSTFASGFPTSGTVGPLGIAFTPGGGVMVSDAPGNVRVFATDTDGQNASSAPIGQNYGSGNADGIAQVGGNYYMVRQSIGDLIQLNATGTFNQGIITGMPLATGIIADPIDGHLFVSTVQNDAIYDVDPIAKTKTLFASAYFDGLSLSADGGILYGARPSDGHIIGYSTATKAIVFDSGAISGGIDGTALGTGKLLGNIFVNTNSGTVYEINLATLAQTLIASGGDRGDFVTVDPNGTLLLTQTSTIVRLIAPAGGGFGSSPEPASVLMVGIGCVGAWAITRRRR